MVVKGVKAMWTDFSFNPNAETIIALANSKRNNIYSIEEKRNVFVRVSLDNDLEFLGQVLC